MLPKGYICENRKSLTGFSENVPNLPEKGMKNSNALKFENRLEICILRRRALLKGRMDKYSWKIIFQKNVMLACFYVTKNSSQRIVLKNFVYFYEY